MRILVLGLPGSGKSTQVDSLADYLKVPAVKMGAILRQMVADKTELGKKIESVMLAGHLVSDEIVEDVIQQKCQELTDGFVMEGYPRTVHQIHSFDPMFDKVFYLKIASELAHQRMMSRAREDDNKDAIENRFNEQMKDLDKILEHYHSILSVVDATQGVDEIFEELIKNLPKERKTLKANVLNSR